MTPTARIIWLVGWPLGIALGAATEIGSVLQGDRLEPWHLAIGWTYIFAGLVVWRRRRGSIVGPLMTAAGFAWFLHVNPDLPYLFSFVIGFEGVDMPLMFHAVLAYPHGRLHTASERAIVIAMYTAITIRGVAFLLTAEPPVACNECDELAPFPNAAVAEQVDRIIGIVGALIAVAVVVLLVRRFLRASPARRVTLLELWIAGIALGAFLALIAVTYARGEDASNVHFHLGYAARLAIPAALLAGTLRRQLARAAVGGLIVELDPHTRPQDLRGSLARALRDPTVDVAYWVPDRGTFVDQDGRPVTLPQPGGDRAVSMIERDAQRLAALVHDPALLDQPELVRAASAATALALENARLHAEVRMQLEEVRASRVRIVEAADAARIGIERNLHDGAQQRLLALAMMLRDTRRRLGAESSGAGASLEAALEELNAALGELRELARGVYPSILSDEGLGPALESLAERAPVATTVSIDLNGRLPASVEATAYFVASEALANVAKHAGASQAHVAARSNGAMLFVEIRDDGAGRADPARGSGLRGLDDRVRAVGGTLLIDSTAGRGTRIAAEIPCG